MIIYLLCATLGGAGADEGDLAQRILRARTPHELLGLPTNAPMTQINRAYKEILLRYYAAANLKDPEAERLIKLANSAKDALTKPSIDPQRPASWTNAEGKTVYVDPPVETAARAGAPPNAAEWGTFKSAVDAAPSRAERDALREARVGAVKDPFYFAELARGPRHVDTSVEAIAFAVKHIDDFLKLNPRLGALNWLAAVGVTPEGQMQIYRAAINAAQTPRQLLTLLEPGLGHTKGALGWEDNLQRAQRDHLGRFFTMGPTEGETREFRAMLKALYPSAGEQMFTRLSQVGGTAPSTGGVKGVFDGLMKKMGRRFFAADPSLITGLTVAAVEQREGDALASLSCPAPLLATRGYVVTTDYTQALAVSGAGDLVVFDCARRSAAAGLALDQALENLNRTALEKLRGPRVTCDAGVIRLSIANGLRAEVRSDANGLRYLEITNQLGRGNPGNYLRYDQRAQTDYQVSYVAANFATNDTREHLANISESEASFFYRGSCLQKGCDRASFLSQTTTTDYNHFTTDLSKEQSDEHHPYGELDTNFIVRASNKLVNLLTLVRTSDEFDADELCRRLGGKPSTSARADAKAGQKSRVPAAAHGPAAKRRAPRR